MANKDKGYKYVLTIVYKPKQDQCEYIQEEVVDNTDKSSWMIGSLDLSDYFEDTDISDLDCCIIGKSQLAASWRWPSLISKGMNMDVWTLGEKYKEQAKDIKQLEARIKYLEDYLSNLTKGNKDENVQDKKSSTSGLRTRRRTTKKS